MGDLVSLKLGGRRSLLRATSALVWYERGVALEATDPEAAVAAYRRALAGRPDLADAHNNLGRLLHDRGELAAAAACYRRAREIEPLVGLYAFNLGVALEDSGCTGEAVAMYEQALALEPALADAHYNLARLIELAARGTSDDLMMRRALRHLHQYRRLLTA
ncbi:MAG TPA: tetratricopeptide repeat protein [Kofleriaceae bacterium]|nr:tetratricopeptide repeat protein [Kofleriaceae bacterium]